MHADSRMQRHELKRNVEGFCHFLKQSVYCALQDAAKLSTVAPNRRSHYIPFKCDGNYPICQVADPFSNEQLHIDHTERCLGAA